MFVITIRMILIGLILSAEIAFAAKRLSLHISGPQSINGIDNLKLIATVTNTGDGTLQLLKDLRGVLSTMPTHKFIIRNAVGDEPRFTGAIINSALADSTAMVEDEDLIILAPGEQVDVGHDLSNVYDFTFPGAGSYIFQAHNLFHHVESTTTTTIYAQISMHEASISGRLAIQGESLAIELAKGPTFIGCDSEQTEYLTFGFHFANLWLDDANQYMRTHFGRSAVTARYTTWFGSFEWSQYGIVWDKIELMLEHGFPDGTSPYTYNCSCTIANAGAWVNAKRSPGVVNICPYFWTLPIIGRITQAGVLVHEASHFQGTVDHVYTEDRCKALARTSPGKAIHNADSYMYFVENFPKIN